MRSCRFANLAFRECCRFAKLPFSERRIRKNVYSRKKKSGFKLSKPTKAPPTYSVIDATYSTLYDIFSRREAVYVPADHRPPENATSTIGAGLNLLKASLGGGILAMPLAFKNVGWLGGVLGTIIVGIVCTHAVHILVKTSQMICHEAHFPFLGYADTCDFTFRYGPPRLQKCASFVREFADWALAVLHLGACSVYGIIIAQIVQQVSDYYGGPAMDVRVWCAIGLVVLLPLTQIQKLKHLVPFSAVANGCWLICIVISVSYCFVAPGSVSERTTFKVNGIPLFVSVSLFAMEGIGIVMPTENEMRNPELFRGCPGVLNIVMTIVVVLYGFVGFMGYWKYGDNTKGSLILNLPKDDVLAQVVKIFVSIILMLTFALIFYVPVDVVWRRLEIRIKPEKHFKAIAIIRFIGCILAVIMSIAIPKLDLFIELLGALFLLILGVLMPAILETVHYWSRHYLKHRKLIFFKNALIALFTVLALFSGSLYALKNMIDGLSS